MHRAFVSYYHYEDQSYKYALDSMNADNDIYVDYSVQLGDIDDTYMTDDQIRRKIRDEYLRDSSVTILLCGKNTRRRKHIDWELFSSMYDGSVSKRSGVLVINLPSIENQYFHASHGTTEKEYLYPSVTGWITVETKAEYQERYPYMPDRILDSMLKGAKISVANWSKIENNPDALRYLIDATFDDRRVGDYDLSAMRRRDS